MFVIKILDSEVIWKSGAEWIPEEFRKGSLEKREDETETYGEVWKDVASTYVLRPRLGISCP